MIDFTSFRSVGVSCVSPLHIKNRFDGNYYTVGCGHCPACLELKRHRLISSLETLRSNSKSVYFVTLTYNNDFVPYATFDGNEVTLTTYDFYHKCYRDETFNVSDYFYSKFTRADSLLFKIGSFDYRGIRLGKGRFYVLHKPDLQKFFKRFRKYALSTQNVNFKYFAIGEYGSYSLRPHFHAIIFMDSTVSYSQLCQDIRNCWRFGRVDVQSVTSTASSYVSSYINAVGNVPYFLREIKSFKPFYCRSCKGIFEFFPNQVRTFVEKDLFKLPYLQLKQTSSGFTVAPLSRSIRIQFFPVCPGFHSLNYLQKCECYSIFKDAVFEQKTLNPSFKLDCSPCSGGEHRALSINFKDLFAYVKRFDNPSKKVDWCITNSDFMKIYVSYRVFKLCRTFGFDFDSYVRYIIAYYEGSPLTSTNSLLGNDYSDWLRSYQDTDPLSLPNSNFELSLLRFQYQQLETCDSSKDLAFYYSFYNCKDFNSLCRDSDDFLLDGCLPFFDDIVVI